MALCSLFFILYYLYLWKIIDLRLIYHEGGMNWDFPVFYVGLEFFRRFTSYPGGLVEYVSTFCAQFFYIGWAGALVATVQVWLLWLCTGVTVRAASGRRIRWVGFVGPILLLSLYAQYKYPSMYEHYVYPFDIAMDLLIVLGFAYLYMMTTSRAGPLNLAIFAVLSIIVYVAAGEVYLLFSAICGFYELLFRRRLTIALIFLVTPVTVAYLVSRGFFDFNAVDAFNGFMPRFFGGDTLTLTVVYALYLLLPLTLVGLWFAELVHKRARASSIRSAEAGLPKATKKIGQGRFGRLRMWLGGESASIVTPLLAIIASLPVVYLCLDSRIKAMIAVDYYASRGMWNKVLETAEPYQHNKYTGHLINRALYHTGRLSNDMFKYNQVPGALMLSNESESTTRWWWASDTYFCLGHMNIAESTLSYCMETFGERPVVLKRLALVNMVKGNTGAAKVYLGALSRTLFHADWAKDYLEKIERDPNLSTDEEIQRLRGLVPETDREFASLDDSLFLDLLDKNRGNQMAFEYLAANYLLTGQLDKFAGIIDRLEDFDYKVIPRLYEEAILLHNHINKKKIELPGREISRESLRRFKSFNYTYITLYGGNRKLAFNRLAKNYGNSYLFYHIYATSGIMNK